MGNTGGMIMIWEIWWNETDMGNTGGMKLICEILVE
jgi:hypothetical protein